VINKRHSLRFCVCNDEVHQLDQALDFAWRTWTSAPRGEARAWWDQYATTARTIRGLLLTAEPTGECRILEVPIDAVDVLHAAARVCAAGDDDFRSLASIARRYADRASAETTTCSESN
jgi:hypothetical protein